MLVSAKLAHFRPESGLFREKGSTDHRTNLPKRVGVLNVRWGQRVIGTSELVQLVRCCQAGSPKSQTVAVYYWLSITASKVPSKV